MLWTKWPIEPPFFPWETAKMTKEASNSNITWVRFNSWAKRTPCSRARNSVHSARKCEGRALQRAVITPPVSSQMITPTPEMPQPSNEQAPSTLTLAKPDKGATQPWRGDYRGVKSHVEASLNSSTIFLAKSQIRSGGRPLSSWLILFVLFQIDQAMAKKKSRCLSSKGE